MILAASPTSIAVVLAVVLSLGWLVYVIIDVRRGRKEAGAELVLAPNRKPYYTDEELEGPRLERTQVAGVGLLVVCAIGVPLYWLNEPTRQAEAITNWNEEFAAWGAADFATTADGGFNCAGCHGGMKATGGVAPYTLTDPNTGEVRAVNWNAPALNTVLYRFSIPEVRYILVYGRPFSPMSPWGLDGGGPMNAQQIDNIIEYLKTIQLPQEGCEAEDPLCNGNAGVLNAKTQEEIQQAAEDAVAAGEAATIGEALFNLELSAGAYNCARCHTKGWSYGDPQVSGGGAFGPNLTAGATVRQFPDAASHSDFIKAGSEQGKRYGQQGQGSGRMPGFGTLLTDAQIAAIVEYERGL